MTDIAAFLTFFLYIFVRLVPQTIHREYVRHYSDRNEIQSFRNLFFAGGMFRKYRSYPGGFPLLTPWHSRQTQISSEYSSSIPSDGEVLVALKAPFLMEIEACVGCGPWSSFYEAKAEGTGLTGLACFL